MHLHPEAGFSSWHRKIYHAISNKQIRTFDSIGYFHLAGKYKLIRQKEKELESFFLKDELDSSFVAATKAPQIMSSRSFLYFTYLESHVFRPSASLGKAQPAGSDNTVSQ